MEMKKQMNFNLLLDLGHLHVSDNTLNLDYTQECSNLKEIVKWLHISDNNGIVDEHKPLKSNSDIVREFSRIYTPDINITLETVGNVEDILESIRILKA
jgi:sugar phosphate isomerase/epimerase